MVLEHYDKVMWDAWDEPEVPKKDEIMIKTAPSSVVYSKLSKRLNEMLSRMEIEKELQQLEVNKDDLCVTCVDFKPEFGYILIKMDLSRLNINLEHASFIDIDVTQDLCLEIKFLKQRVADNAQDVENQ